MLILVLPQEPASSAGLISLLMLQGFVCLLYLGVFVCSAEHCGQEEMTNRQYTVKRCNSYSIICEGN